MRTLKITIFFILFIYAAQSNAQYDSLFASVDGNIVTLWETGTQRNCGAMYEMTVNLNDHYMKWVQLDTGIAAYCLCVYDLSVTYGPLEPGDYTVDVYFTSPVEPGDYYEGSIVFSIGGDRNVADGGIISQYQSDCYAGIDDPESAEEFRIYPVPLADGEILNVEATSTGGQSILEIFTMSGKRLFNREYDRNQPIHDRFLKEELFPVAGIYVVRLKTSEKDFTRKITVL